MEGDVVFFAHSCYLDMTSTLDRAPETDIEPSAPAAEARAPEVAIGLATLLDLLASGASGTALSAVLARLQEDLSHGDVLLASQAAGLRCNDGIIPCGGAPALCRCLVDARITRLELQANTSQRELLNFAALLGGPAANVAANFVQLWSTYGSWHIRVRWADATAPVDASDASAPPARVDDTDTEIVARLRCALEAEVLGTTPPEGERFDDLATDDHLQVVANLVHDGASLRETAPLVALLRRAGAKGTAVLLSRLAQTSAGSSRRRYFDAIVAAGVAAPHLVAALEHNSWFVVRNAALLLGELRVRFADTALVNTLVHPDPRVRIAVVQALVALQTDLTPPALDRALRDASANVRAEAWRLMTRQPLAPSPELVLAALRTEADIAVQRALVTCLHHHQVPGLHSMLVRFCARILAHGGDSLVVCDTLPLLAADQPRSLVPFLRRLSEDPSPAVRARMERISGLAPEAVAA
jgi:hypothetical protein